MLDNTGKRQLAYLVKIDAITPIEKADRLEAAHVGGWVVVVSKGEFKVGDPAIYLEIDSQVAIDKAPWCDMDFLVSKKGKIKTQKIRGQISQGLLVPVTAFGWTICENTVIKDDKGEYHHIDDESRFLTKQLGITYSSVEDRKRKGAAPDEYKKMAQRHPEFGKKWWWKKLYRSNLGKKILFVFFGKKKDSAIAFPTKFPGVTVTDQERCVIGQTKILTDQGPIQISKIVNQQLPVKVLSVNNETGKFEWKRILQYQKFKNDYKPVLTIGYPYFPGVKTRLNHICCTPDHRFLTQRGYIHAKDLQTTDYLYMPEDLEYLIGTKSSHYVRENRPVKVPVLSVELGQHKNVSISQSFKFVYDLEVEDNHNFVADNVVTHNCENMTYVLRDKTPFIVTQKCDGSSGTFILERKKFGKYEFYVCSRNVRQLKPEQKCFYDENYYWQVAIKYDIENKMKAWLKTHPKAWFVCWQGEVCGPKIQGNPQHLSEVHLFCFHWTDSINGRRDIRDAEKDWRAMGMEVVPIKGIIVLPDDFEEFKQMADGKYDPSVCEGHKDCNREGWVLYKTNEPTFSFKNVSRKYLLGKKD